MDPWGRPEWLGNPYNNYGFRAGSFNDYTLEQHSTALSNLDVQRLQSSNPTGLHISNLYSQPEELHPRAGGGRDSDASSIQRDDRVPIQPAGAQGPTQVARASGPMSSSVVIPNRPKPGRKPIAQEDAADRRRIQNRMAQRSFRDKRQQKLADTQLELEERKREYEKKVNELERNLDAERREKQELATQNEAMAARLQGQITLQVHNNTPRAALFMIWLEEAVKQTSGEVALLRPDQTLLSNDVADWQWQQHSRADSGVDARNLTALWNLAMVIRAVTTADAPDSQSAMAKSDGDETNTGVHPAQKPDWDNLSVLHRNTLPPRSSFLLYNSEDDALSRDPKKAKAQCLSGDRWHFHLANSPFEAPAAFEDTSFDCGKWSKIDVPGMWQMQGFGRGPHYTNVQYPFAVDPPHPPYTNNECGSYIKRFRVLDDLQDEQLRLRFEGVDSAFHVWVNGREIGYSQGSRNPSEFDITEYVKRGEENVLAVRVYQFCDGSYIEDQDQWWLSGIFRDVFLLGFPKKVHFEDVTIQTLLDKEYRDATLQVRVRTSAKATVRLQLLDADHKLVAEGEATADDGTKLMADFAIPVKNPEKWTAETPYLYKAILSIGEDQFSAHQVGFRQVELKDGLIKVNGMRVVFKGANRHEHHPESGRTVPYEFLKNDLLLMKQHNINAIRTSHQPNDTRLYDLADELGFWLMDEADLECHGFEIIADAALPPEQRKLPFAERQRITRSDAAKWTSDKPEWHDAYVDRAKQVVHRDKNHPSVVLWSLGNEAFYGRNHTAMRDWIRAEDPTRLIHYEPDQDAEYMDMYSRMYPQISDIIELAKKECKQKMKPLVLCEYIHAMGTGPGNIKEYVDTFYKYPQLQGGWVWEWANHGLLTKAEDGTPFYGYGGDFGDIPNDENFVMDGVLQSDHTPNSGLLEYKKALEPVQFVSASAERVTIINRQDFATLDFLVCRWSVVSEKGPIPDMGGKLSIPSSIRPGETAELAVPEVNAELPGEAFLMLSFRLRSNTPWADAGYELAWAQVPLARNTTLDTPSKTGTGPVVATLSGSTLEIASHTSQWSVDIARGALSRWRKNGVEVISRPLVPSFYRAPTDNDAPASSYGKDWKGRFLHLADTQTRGMKWHVEDNGSLVVRMEQKFAPPVLSWSIDLASEYTFETDGSLSIKIRGTPSGLNLPKTLPRIGVTLGLPKSFQKVEWFGRGPGESYKDMKLSQKVGRHAVQSVGALWSGPEFPQECSNRTDTRWVKIAERTHGKTSLTAQFFDPSESSTRRLFDFMVSHFDVKDIDEARHPYELDRKAQDATILRLDADHHGLGTGSCGPKTLDEYVLKTAPFEFGILLH
ncbi:hypothetical protein B0A55_04532 [Friedmanniomyces simplex]|uniref:beta-galactosidase n=1 Tax=Friedmanniomyces simplex TaxID=329884 RepID=A0A4U0XN02_9PEZI|nr:hypothetical protein B0A55_04532 [Friedmanniomyces simplex]